MASSDSNTQTDKPAQAQQVVRGITLFIIYFVFYQINFDNLS